MTRKYVTKTLGIDGTRLTLDGKLFDWQGLSFFNAIYNPAFNQSHEERLTRLKDYKENGISALRVWCQWNFGPPRQLWVDTAPQSTMYTDAGDIREESFEKLTSLIKLADNLDIVIEVVLFSHEKQPNFPVEILENAAGNMAERLKPYGNILIQIWNEDSTEVFRLFKRIKEVDPDRITTSSPGLPNVLGDDEQNYMLDVLTPHTIRGAAKRCFWEEAASQIEYLMKRFKKPVIDDEPARTGIKNFGGIPESNPEQHIAQIKLVRALEAYSTYHHDMFQNGYGDPATPPQAIPNPYFSYFHRQVFAFLKSKVRAHSVQTFAGVSTTTKGDAFTMKIVIASDKAGFELKEKVKENFRSKGWELEDVGLTDLQGYMAFYTASDNLCRKIQAGEAERGILICGTGAGMCINANKYKGIYAVACESIYSARMCRIVNNANVLTMGSNIVGPGMAVDICEAFLTTGFAEGMPQERADYLKNLYGDYMKFLGE